MLTLSPSLLSWQFYLAL